MTYTYTYDDNNQLSEVRIPGHGSITYASYQWNRPESITLPGGSTKDYAYDPLMRVKEITSKDPGGNVLVDYDYAYDRMDNITTKATEHGDYTYGYDDLYRLLDADNPTVSDEAFTYDPVGNRLTSAATTGEWTYNPNNELGEYDGTTFAYDENGNTIRKTQGTEVTHYIYNEEDRLVRVKDGFNNVIAEYHYDPFGRRLWKEVDGERTYFVYSDEGLIGECDDTGSLTRSYGYVPGSTWTTDPLFMKEEGEYYFYHNDHLGTPQKMTASNGAVVWSARYSSFGKVDIEVETVQNNLRFPGQYEDQESGLHYNYNRYYHPRTGRYLRVDPIGLVGGINLYIYVENDPTNYFDNFGLIPCPEKDYLRCQRICECKDSAVLTCEAIPIKINLWVAIITVFDIHCLCYGDVPKNPDDLLKRGYKETSHPDAKDKGHRTFENPKTGDKIRFDKGKPGASGHEGKDHYHRYNPNSTGKHDYYLDKKGNPVSRNSNPSHIYPSD